MAGTGHSYEIANIQELHLFLKGFHVPKPFEEWLFSKKFLKFVTSPNFTYPVSSTAEIEECADAGEIEYLLGKHSGGVEIRLFSKTLVEARGVDIRHALDWIRWLKEEDPRRFSKLHKFPVDQVLQESRDWLKFGVIQPLHAGKSEEVLQTSAGRLWVKLLDGDALTSEGRSMSHCVWSSSYQQELAENMSAFYSLREGSRALVTIQIDVRSCSIIQAQGFANSAIPFYCHQCLADLLNHLKVIGGLQNSSTIGVVRQDDGVWKKLIDVWEEIDWQGFRAFRHGNDILVLSKRYPGRSLCRVHLFPNETNKGTVQVDADRHYHIEEQRDIARIVSSVGYGGSINGFNLVRRGEGWIPFFDSLEREDVGGVICLFEDVGNRSAIYDTRKVYIPHSGDDARSLVVINRLASYSNRSVRFLSPERWNISEAKRAFRALSHLKEGILERDEAFKLISKKFDPVYIGSKGWRLFGLDAKLEAGLTDPGFNWMVADYMARMRTKHGWISALRDENGLVTSFDKFWMDLDGHREAAAFLNSHGWVPREGYRFGDVSWFKDKSDERPFRGLFYFRGQWHAPSSYDEMIAIFKTKAKRARSYRLDPIESETVISSLSPDAEGVDDILAEAFKWWLKSGSRKSDLSVLGSASITGTPTTSPHTSIEGRLESACNLMEHFDESYHRHFRRLADMVLRERMRDKSILRSKDVMDYLSSYHPWVSDKLFVRALNKGNRLGSLTVRVGDDRRPCNDVKGLYARAKQLGHAYSVVEAANWGAFHFRAEGTELSLKEAEGWLDCFEIAAQSYWTDRMMRGVEQFEAMVSGHLSGGTNAQEWTTVQQRLAAVKAIHESKEAARQEKYAA